MRSLLRLQRTAIGAKGQQWRPDQLQESCDLAIGEDDEKSNLDSALVTKDGIFEAAKASWWRCPKERAAV
jgi:hypothetical protein